MGTEYAAARNSEEKWSVTQNVATTKKNVNYTFSRQAWGAQPSAQLIRGLQAVVTVRLTLVTTWAPLVKVKASYKNKLEFGRTQQDRRN